MTGRPAARYDLWASEAFDFDYRRLSAAADRNPSGPEAHLRREVVRQMKDLMSGKTDGHHALGYESGKGDLRDCVTSYLQSDPQAKADHRMVFREIGPGGPGQLPRRELLAVKPRQGSGNIYEHACARLARHPNDMQPGLDRFGRRPASSGGNQADRQAELDAKRAIAHAWAGQQPLATSRPLDLSQFGQRGTPAHSSGPSHDPGRER